MKVSVLIPAYRASATIEAALDSVFEQSLRPEEVIVLLDGNEDDTESRLRKFEGKIRLLKQPHRGAPCARNELVAAATGDILAFLDADDLWHPNYLETQCRLFATYPTALASFTGHVSFRDGGSPTWQTPNQGPVQVTELIDGTSFFIRCNVTTSQFASMSFCCLNKRAFDLIGPEPFSNNLRSAQDLFLYFQVALLGAVAFDPSPLVAYRFTDQSLSSNRVRSLGYSVEAFAQLENRYRSQASSRLRRAFLQFYASRRRQYAKLLVGAGQVDEGRRQLIASLRNCKWPMSIGKSVGLLAATMLPRPLQPSWPSSLRKVTL